MKGEGIVFAKNGKSFDPVQIPKAIKDAGFTATEVTVLARGAIVRTATGLQLNVPGLNHSFLLAGGTKAEALTRQTERAGPNFEITGKLQQKETTPTLTVDDFREAH